MAGLTRAEREQKIDAAIQTLLKYRTAGDGGNAIKLLLTFVKNVNDNPQELKYRSINTESSAFKTKLSSLIGPLVILRAIGFQADDEGKLKLDGYVVSYNNLLFLYFNYTIAYVIYDM